MTISEGYKTNFDTLLRAVHSGDAALLECQDARTGAQAIVICAVQRDGEEYQFVPLARLFDGNPYEELNPPNPSGGFYSQAEVWQGERPGAC